MSPRSKARGATAPIHRQRQASTAVSITGPALATYTKSYLVVQRPSPPPSSPSRLFIVPPPIDQIPRLQYNTTPSSPDFLRPKAKRRRAVRSTAPERPVSWPQRAAGRARLGLRKETRSNIERAAQRRALSPRGKIQQTTKLIKVLARNKPLLYVCLAEDKDEGDEECKMIMEKISKAVKDDRFQSWRKVKRWIMTRYRAQQRNSGSSHSATSSCSSSGASKKNTTFRSNLMCVLNTVEMSTTAKRFLGSVTQAMGEEQLARKFRQRLVHGKLPADISPLIFSPPFPRIYEKQVQKVKWPARHRDDTDTSDADSWSDPEEGDPTPDAIADFTNTSILPSIEEDGNLCDTRRPTTERATNKSFTPSERGSEVRALRARTDREARRIVPHAGRRITRRDERRRRRRGQKFPHGSLNPFDVVNHQHTPGPHHVQPQNQAGEHKGTHREMLGFSLSPTPRVCRSTESTLPAPTSRHDSDEETLFVMKSMSQAVNERSGDGNSDKNNNNSGMNGNRQHSHTPHSKRKWKWKQKDKAEAHRQGEDASVSRTRGKSRSASRLKETPAILVEESWGQSRKPARSPTPKEVPSRAVPRKGTTPVRRRWKHKEIPPRAFYNKATPDIRTGTASQPGSYGYRQGAHIAMGPNTDEGSMAGKGSGVIRGGLPHRASLLREASSSDESFLSLHNYFPPKQSTPQTLAQAEDRRGSSSSKRKRLRQDDTIEGPGDSSSRKGNPPKRAKSAAGDRDRGRTSQMIIGGIRPAGRHTYFA